MSSRPVGSAGTPGGVRPKDLWDVFGVLGQVALGTAGVLITIFLHQRGERARAGRARL